MKRILLLMAVVVAMGVCAKQRSTRQKLRAEPLPATVEATAAADTLRGDTVANIVRVSGYEKPLRSRHETMMLTNNDSTITVTAVQLEITYLDMQGRALHKRTATAATTLPPGATRLIDLKSWDVNMLFYYHLNAPTRTTSQGTPYRVTVSPTLLVYSR
jgi:hypothetical protein